MFSTASPMAGVDLGELVGLIQLNNEDDMGDTCDAMGALDALYTVGAVCA